MKKKILAIILIALMIVSLTACKKVSDKALIKSGTLMVACEPEYPPMEFKNDKAELIGFDVEFAKALADELGLKVEYVESAWDGIFLGLAADKYDVVISSVSRTQERLDGKDMTLSDAYINNGQFTVVLNGNTSIESFAGLTGKKVGVQLATTADDACEGFLATTPNAFSLTKYDSIQMAFMALQSGAIDVVVVDELVALYYCNNHPNTYLMSTTKLTNEPVAIAIKYNNTELAGKINDAIKKLKDNGTLKTLSEKYLGKDATDKIDNNLTQ